MKYISKILLSFLLVISVLLGSNPFYASAQTGDDAGLSASSDAEMTYNNPINLPAGQYRIRLNFFDRKQDGYCYDGDYYSLSTYGLLTINNNKKATLKLKKYCYLGAYADLFLKGEKAATAYVLAESYFPSFAADSSWDYYDYNSNSSKLIDGFEASDFYGRVRKGDSDTIYGNEEGFEIEKISDRNAAYITVPFDLDYGCLIYYSWYENYDDERDQYESLENYVIVPDIQTAISVDELYNAKNNTTMYYQYTESLDGARRVPVSAEYGTNLIENFDMLESESTITSKDDNGLTAKFFINGNFTENTDYKVATDKFKTSPRDTDGEHHTNRWGGTEWQDLTVTDNSFELTFTNDEIIFGKEIRFIRRENNQNRIYHTAIIPLAEKVDFIDITDEETGIVFRYSNYCLPEDIKFNVTKATTGGEEIPEKFWDKFYNSQVDTTTIDTYALNITYEDGTPIPQYIWDKFPCMIIFPKTENMEGKLVFTSAYQENAKYADGTVYGSSDKIEGDLKPWMTAKLTLDANDNSIIGYDVQDKEAMYHCNALAFDPNYSLDTYVFVYQSMELVNIESNYYEPGIYEAEVTLLRQGSDYSSACNKMLSSDAYIVIKDDGTKDAYLNFTEEGEVAYGSGYYQGGLKAYDNRQGEYIENSEVVYSYMCNSDGTLLDNTSYNALTEFPCILSTRITLDSRSVYTSPSLAGHYRMGIISPVMAAMSGLPYDEVDYIGVDLGITAIERVGDLSDVDELNSIPTYQKSVLMRSIQRGDLYLEGKADYSADAVAALEEAVEAGREYYYNDLKDVDNKYAVKEQSDRIKELSDAIESAITGLDTPGNVDKSGLEAAITEAEALTEEEYTTLSWGNLSKALSDAVVTNNRADVSQSVVNAEAENLNAAIQALVKRSEDAAAPADLADGTYRIPVGLYKAYNVKSSSDAALDIAYLHVKNGQATVEVQFVPWEEGAVNLTKLSTLSNVTAQVWNSYEIASCDKTEAEPAETYTVGEATYPKKFVFDVTLPANLNSNDNYIWTETSVRSGETEVTEYARLYLDYTGILNVTEAWNAVDTAKTYVESEYTAESWKNFTDALTALENALQNTTDKAVLQEAVNVLANAQKALTKISAPEPQQPSTQNPQQTTQAPQTGQQTPTANAPQNGSQQAVPVVGVVGETFKVKGNTYRLTSNGTNPTAMLVKASKKKKKITVPASVKKNGVAVSVTAIGNNAFKNRKKVRTVVIGKKVQRIGKNAFAGCRNLRKITVKSKTLRVVGKNAFRGISSRAVIKVPKKSLKRYQKLFRNKGQRRTVVIR